MMNNTITVFTKPWRECGLAELANLVKGLGFGGVELAVRPGYQVEPENAVAKLPLAADIFRQAGLQIASVASEVTPRMIEACHKAAVPIIRTMLPVNPEEGYHRSIGSFQEHCREVEPHLEGTAIRIGVQNHCGNFVGTAHGLMAALEPLPDSFVAVLDLAHTSLAGEPSPYAVEIARPRLAMVNLKNARPVVRERNGNGEAVWDRQWVPARDGLTSWSEAVHLIRKHGFDGPLCLTAEYRDNELKGLSGDAVLPLIRGDFQYLDSLLKA